MNHATVAMDSSCLIAAVSGWHEHHTVAAHAVEECFRTAKVVIPAHALVEAYSVLTRLPSPNRLAGADAWYTLNHSFTRRARVVTLEPAHYAEMLQRASGAEIVGGRIYDEVIAESARRHAGVLVTLNRRHFDPPPLGLRVVDPRSSTDTIFP